MDILNEDCLAIVFDFLAKSEKDSIKRQNLVLSLCQVCTKWKKVINFQPSRFIECAVINKKNHALLPVEHIKRAIIVKKTPSDIVTRTIFRFTSQLKYLKLTHVQPKPDIVDHLRTIKLSNLCLKGHSKWDVFWKNNPDLESLEICSSSDRILNNLPANLKKFTGTVDTDCLTGCTSLESLTLNGRFESDLAKLRFPALKEIELLHHPHKGFNEFITSHSNSLQKLAAADFDLTNVDGVQFPKLEYLNLDCLYRKHGFDNFPNLKSVVLHSYPPQADDLRSMFPTEASNLESITLLFDCPKRLLPNLQRLTRLRALNVGINHDLLKTVRTNLKTLQIQVSNYNIIDLRNITLEELVIDRHPDYVSSSDRRLSNPFFIFPPHIKRVIVKTFFTFLPSTIQIEELYIMTSLECNLDFIRHCASTLRIFHLEGLFNPKKLKYYLLDQVFNRQLPVLQAIYVTIKCKKLEKKIRLCCNNLQIFKIMEYDDVYKFNSIDD